MPEPGELDPVAARLIRASLTVDKLATDRILTRAVEADLDGLFFAFTTANLGLTRFDGRPSSWGSSPEGCPIMESMGKKPRRRRSW
jgi:hypothetical protein